MDLFYKNEETQFLLKDRNSKWSQKYLKWRNILPVLGILLLGGIYLARNFIHSDTKPEFNETIKIEDRRRFYVDYERNEFIKDGEIFRYVSGSLHYFRVPRPYWRDRIRKMKAAGLNAVTFYIEWSFHEPYSGVYNFEGQADFEHFLMLLKEENMMALVRPGPYISAERDFGGFPYWLLKEKPNIHLRSSDPNYLKFVKRWFSVFMPKIVPFLYGNGGNIIMIQIENEYGYNDKGECDKQYTLWLRDLVQHFVGDKAQLYTTDQCNLSFMKCAHIPNVYSTVDFPVNRNATECFGYVRQVQGKGPSVNSETYDGWVAYWNEPRLRTAGPEKIVKMLKYFLAINASLNFYVFHGGTNFGFTSGATTVGPTLETAGYRPVLTSYDFEAPLDEAGDPTEKYFAIQRALREMKFPTSSIPKRSPKGNYGTVYLEPVVSLFDRVSQRIKPVVSDVPLCFEDMDLNHGLVLYETDLPSIGESTKLPLRIDLLRDRAIVFLNYVKLGTMSRSQGNTTIDLTLSAAGGSQKLSVLVENQGRISEKRFLEDRKGILSNVTLGKHVLGPWTMTGYPLNDTSWLKSQNIRSNVTPPAFYKGVFFIPQNNEHVEPLDTFLDTSGWSKGVAFVNDINIGRYWPAVGPQITLYIPATFLVPGKNTIVLVELEGVSEDLTVKLVDKHRLDY